jgi:hypothetical protein
MAMQPIQDHHFFHKTQNLFSKNKTQSWNAPPVKQSDAFQKSDANLKPRVLLNSSNVANFNNPKGPGSSFLNKLKRIALVTALAFATIQGVNHAGEIYYTLGALNPGGPLQTQGQTAEVYYNQLPYSGAKGAAEATQAAFNQDYAKMKEWFGVDLPKESLPVQIYVSWGIPGAGHASCASTTYIATDAKDRHYYLTPMVTSAELAESFMATKNNGWDCGYTNGEALSRVVAYYLHPETADDPGFIKPRLQWWNDGHKDYINQNTETDRNLEADEAGALFIMYLHDQLGFSMQEIINAGGENLGQTYVTLMASRGIHTTGQQGFENFIKTLEKIQNSDGTLNLPAQGKPAPQHAPVPYDPFPITK